MFFYIHERVLQRVFIGIMMERINRLNQENEELNRAYIQRADNKKVYTVQEIQDILDISKNMAYQIAADAPFKVMKIGGAIRISKASFDAWLEGEEAI